MDKKPKFSLILPVLFYEYLAISMARSLIPSMLVREFGSYSYLVVGITETVKGLLAFISCPFFGKISDRIGRKYCLLISVTGTTMPVFLLAFFPNMYVYSVAQAISGCFSVTFPLTFAYISDCVDKKKRAPAYGLALATFGLSFCIGPVSGSYLSQQFAPMAVFLASLTLVLINIVYITSVLPETAKNIAPNINKWQIVLENIPSAFDFGHTFRIFKMDPFLTHIAMIVFFYYTSVWAIVSTLMVYVTSHLHFTPVALGWLLSGYGVATMFSEGVLVRLIVPRLGELQSMRIGLLCFACQCIVVAFSKDPRWIYGSIIFSMLSNLVYPSISSLVSRIVEEDMQGEALGALNGIKALTEGFGPLFFGFLMGIFESTPNPGAPYLLACVLSVWSLLHSFELPKQPELLSALANSKRKGNEDAESLLHSSYDSEDGEN